VPPLPEQLLGPLVDTAGDVLRALEPGDRPQALRRLAEFSASGMRTEAARQQLARALESDESFREKVVEKFSQRSEVTAALEGWSRPEAFRLVHEAAERDDLPLLASALYAERPAGWAFGLGAAAVIVEHRRDEKQADDERRARDMELATLDEARRRLEESHATLEAEAARLKRELQDERRTRRGREADAAQVIAEGERRADELEAALGRARAAFDKAETRIEREVERSRELEQELHRVKGELTESEAARLVATERADRTGNLRYADLQALTEAADLAARLAAGLGGVADRARGIRAPEATPPDREKEQPQTKVPAEPPLRLQPSVPAGMVSDSPEGLTGILRSNRVVLVVDGYNVSMLGWGDADIADQRERLGAALSNLHARTRCDVTLVFDGAGIEGVTAPRRPGVRVVYSDAGEEADRVVVREVAGLSNRIPVIVASSDAEVRADAEREGALVVSSATLLRVLRS
jgi:predicted RNA-binding protein with PIN domain